MFTKYLISVYKKRFFFFSLYGILYTENEGTETRKNKTAKGKRKMKWRIFGQGLKDLVVTANSFDEALAIARKINSNYNGGQRI